MVQAFQYLGLTHLSLQGNRLFLRGGVRYGGYKGTLVWEGAGLCVMSVRISELLASSQVSCSPGLCRGLARA